MKFQRELAFFLLPLIWVLGCSKTENEVSVEEVLTSSAFFEGETVPELEGIVAKAEDGGSIEAPTEGDGEDNGVIPAPGSGGGSSDPAPGDPNEGGGSSDPAPSDPNEGGGGSSDPAPSDPNEGGGGSSDPAPSDPNEGGNGSGDPAPSDPNQGGNDSTDPAPSDPNEGGNDGDSNNGGNNDNNDDDNSGEGDQANNGPDASEDENPAQEPEVEPEVERDEFFRFNLRFRRICSVRRSLQGNRWTFFEEAKNLIVSAELIQKKRKRSKEWHAMPQLFTWLGMRKREKVHTKVLVKKDLSHLDLLGGDRKSFIRVNMTELKELGGRRWGKQQVRFLICDDKNNNGKCTDEPIRRRVSLRPTTLSVKHFDRHRKLRMDVWSGRYLNLVEHQDKCEMQYSPLVLDLKGDGIRLTGPESGIQFDINNDGQPVYTGWVASRDDVLLARDLNLNGRIDDGSELFGSATLLNSGERAENGFEALKELDGNGDGVVDAADPDYDQLLIWRDRNFDGISQRRELKPAHHHRVESINLDYLDIQEVDSFGNETRQRSTYQRAVGRSGKSVPRLIVDVWFNTLKYTQ